jgi:hypothetical protein
MSAKASPGLLWALLLALTACPGSAAVSDCPEAPGCPGICCDSAQLCKQQVCDGVEYTCFADAKEGSHRWVRGTVPSCELEPDSGPDLDIGNDLNTDLDADAATTDRGAPDTSGPDLCPCTPGTTEACANDCGDRQCSASCTWGDCSKAGQLIKPSGKGCWSENHCPAGSPGGTGRCVDCWLGCNKDGTTYEHEWCAGSKCQVCSPIKPDCT